MPLSKPEPWPSLPLDAWRDTYETLHMWLQIVGKTRLALAPMENHWWQVALYVTPRGLTTSSMPCGTRTVAVDFDFLDHQLNIRTSDGGVRVIPLVPKSVATFYAEYLDALRSLGIDVRLYATPVEVETAIPFAEDQQHAAYDRDAAERCWRTFVQADRVFKRFRGGFVGKASPVHLFWGSFDLAYTRYSGRDAPRHPGGAPNCPDYVMLEAYSRECSSAGFWLGGGAIAGPAFYAYAYPEPKSYAEHSAGPAGAFYSRDLREFILPYDVVRSSSSPDATLLEFLESTYVAAADLGGWDRAALERVEEAPRKEFTPNAGGVRLAARRTLRSRRAAVVAGAQPLPPGCEDIMGREQRNMELMQTLDDAWNSQDLETFQKRHRPDVVVTWPGKPPTHGVKAHNDEAVDFFKAFPDQHLDNRPYRVFFASEDWTCSIAHFTGTMTGPMMGPDGKEIPPTGKSFEVDFCTVARWDENGQIVEENLFYDLVSFMKQIGLG